MDMDNTTDKPLETPVTSEPLEQSQEATASGVGDDSASLKEQLEQANNQYLRLAADFDNFRKRQANEREHLLKFGAEQTLLSLLPVLDNLKLAQKNLSEDSKPDMLYKSFEMLANQLQESLQTVGLKKIPTDSRAFDPQLHEVLSFIETQDFSEGTILETYKDGYTLHERVIRAAQVVVSKSPEETTEPQKSDNPFETGSTP